MSKPVKTEDSERAGMLNGELSGKSYPQRSWSLFGFGAGGYGAHDVGSTKHSSGKDFHVLEMESTPETGAAGTRKRFCPEERAGWISRIYFIYVNSLIAMGSRKHLEQDDLWDIARDDESARVFRHFKSKMAETVDPITAPNGVVWKTIWKSHGTPFIWSGMLKLVHDLIMFLPPFILERLLHHMGNGGSRTGSFYLACAMLAVSAAENLTINAYFHQLYRMSLHMKSNMINMLYDKSLRITGSVKSEMGVGAIVNLQSNDASKLWNMPLYLHIVWNGPFQIFIVMAMLVRIMNWAPAMAGLVVTVIMIPLSTVLGKYLGTARRSQVKQTDARVKLATEIITGIKAIKLYAWEDAYMERISKLRDAELKHIRFTQLLSSLNSALFQSGPVLVALAAFAVHTAMGYKLTAAVAFPALSLFNLLRFPIIMFPSQVMNMIHARVGLQRIQKFMDADEMNGPGASSANPFDAAPTAASVLPTSRGTASHHPYGGMNGSTHVQEEEGQDDKPLLSKTPNGISTDESLDTTAISLDMDGGAGQASAITTTTAGSRRAVRKVGRGSRKKRSSDGAEGEEEEEEEDAEWWDGQTDYWDTVIRVDHGTFAWDKKGKSAPKSEGGDKGSGGKGGPAAGASKGAGSKGDEKSEKRGSLGSDPVIHDLDLEVCRGQLVMIVGEVGSGKSSLLAAVLGEMTRLSGSVSVSGSMAYTAQDPWIQNSTLRANVLMGSEMDEEHYTSVLAACALGPDLELLPAGDNTEIGEKGVNLSGGQKHRVALARAVYADADVYLLDDPLSAVDAHVGRHLFDSCICGMLAGRTRLLVTHQLQYLPSADVVVVMSDGRIQEMGAYEDLIEAGVDLTQVVKKAEEAAPEAPVAIIPTGQAAGSGLSRGKSMSRSRLSMRIPSTLEDVQEEEEGSGGGERVNSAASSRPPLSKLESMRMARPLQPSRTQSMGAALMRRQASMRKLMPVQDALRRTMTRKEQDGKITKVEERAVGQVDRAIYRTYMRAWMSAWRFLPLAVILGAFAERGLQVGQNYTLSWWSNDTAESAKTGGSPHTARWLLLYFALGMSSIVLQMIRAIMTITGSISASRQLHNELVNKVVRLPMAFYDSQPTGRLLNRLTKDTESVDVQVSGSLNMALICIVNAVLSIVVVAAVAPVALVALVPLCFVYYRVQAVYIASSRELKRLDALAFSPIFSHFSESLHGLATIRAFRKQALFQDKNRAVLDNSNRAYWPIQAVNRWLSVRLEMMGALIVFSTALAVAVLLPSNPGLAGLAITSALNLTGIMNWAVRQATELEVNMNSVERMVEYLKYEEEAPAVIEANRPPSMWPSEGAIEVSHLMVKYRPELDPVLKDLSFSVRGREKVGVCGRTGCGKSTLMITLYRLVEPTSGTIRIDGVDICALGLRDLRSRLSLVPQDPVIFSGTIRSNLDPFDTAPSDSAVWEALRRAGMDGFVRALDGGLDASIKEGGANLSVGQRQLLCMARALLRASRILVLDEATSNVDNTTDNLIQTTIRSAFSDCTVLTIAHRLHTIIDSDRILLLDGGELAEFDSPAVLLRRPTSAFRRLVEETTRGGGLNAGSVADALAAAEADGATGEKGASGVALLAL